MRRVMMVLVLCRARGSKLQAKMVPIGSTVAA
jgi:hypothetical protein